MKYILQSAKDGLKIAKEPDRSSQGWLDGKRREGNLPDDDPGLGKHLLAGGVHRVGQRVNHFAHTALNDLDRAPQARTPAPKQGNERSANLQRPAPNIPPTCASLPTTRALTYCSIARPLPPHLH